MSNKTREELKQIFVNGAKPTEDNFHDWMDSYVHTSDATPNAISNQISTPQIANYWIDGTANFGPSLHSGVLVRKGSEGNAFPSAWYYSMTPNTLAIGGNNGGADPDSYPAAISLVEARLSIDSPQDFYTNTLAPAQIGSRNNYQRIGVESIMSADTYHASVVGSISAVWFTAIATANSNLLLVGAENTVKVANKILNPQNGKICGSLNSIDLNELDVFNGPIAAGYYKASNSGTNPVHNIYAEGHAKNFLESGITTGAPSLNGTANTKFGRVLQGTSTTITTDQFMEIESDGILWKVPVIAGNNLPVSSMLAWWKADAIDNTLVNGAIDVLKDQSGNSNDIAALSATTRPTLYNNWRNNKPMAYFNGAQVMKKTLLSLPPNTGDITVFVAGEKYGVQLGVLFQSGADINTPDSYAFLLNQSMADQTCIHIDTKWNVHCGDYQATVDKQGIYTINLCMNNSIDAQAYHEFNGQAYQIPLDRSDLSGSLFSDAPFYIGAGTDGTSAFAYFGLAEMIIMPKKASDTEKATIINYLKTKYNF